MAKPTEHTITADLPRQLGEGGDTDHFKADLTFSYLPGAPPSRPTASDGGDPGFGPELELIKVVPLDGRINLVFSDGELKVMAENWLADEGYGMACQHAERERHGDWE